MEQVAAVEHHMVYMLLRTRDQRSLVIITGRRSCKLMDRVRWFRWVRVPALRVQVTAANKLAFRWDTAAAGTPRLRFRIHSCYLLCAYSLRHFCDCVSFHVPSLSFHCILRGTRQGRHRR